MSSADIGGYYCVVMFLSANEYFVCLGYFCIEAELIARYRSADGYCPRRCLRR